MNQDSNPRLDDAGPSKVPYPSVSYHYTKKPLLTGSCVPISGCNFVYRTATGYGCLVSCLSYVSPNGNF